MYAVDYLISGILNLGFKASIIIGGLYLLFWILKPKALLKYRIPQPIEIKPDSKRELPLLVMGLVVYLIPGVILIYLKNTFNYSPMYLDINEYGITYFFLTFIIFAVVIDTWFYWAHRFMHSKKSLRKAHRVHHKSYNITPISSYSFHFTEALINMLPYGILVLIIPWHPLSLLVFGLWGMIYNSYVHLGYDIPLEVRKRLPLCRYFYSSTHHSIHHQK